MINRVDGGLFVVRRSFKAHGVLYPLGQVVEDPDAIKLIRSRLTDRDVLELLPGDNKVNASWLTYFESRCQEPVDSRVILFCGGNLDTPQEEEVPLAPVVAAPTVVVKEAPIIAEAKPKGPVVKPTGTPGKK